MGLRAAWKALWGGDIETKASAAGPLVALFNQGAPVLTNRNSAAFAEEGYRRNVVAFLAINAVAAAVASVPLKAFRSAGADAQEATEHPLLTLLNKPNPTQARAEFIEAVIGYLLIGGNSYIEAVGPERRGATPTELWVLRSDRMTVVAGETGLPSAYEYKLGGRTRRWDADPVTGASPIRHIKTFHPLDDFYGLSPMEAAAYAIDQHNAAGQWNVALMQNGARPSGALVFDPKDGGATLDDIQFQRLKAEIEQQHEGARNAGRPMLLEGGLKWQEMSLSPKDMDFMNAKHASSRDIAAALGVPPQMLGIPGDNTYSNYQEARLAFWEQTVIPRLWHLVGELNAWLAPLFGGVELRPDLDEVPALAERREKFREQVRRDVETGLKTINEGRALLGDEPFPAGDVAFISAGKLPLTAAGDEDDPGAEEPDDEDARSAAILAYGDPAQPEPGSAAA